MKMPAIEMKRAYLDGYTSRSEPYLRHAVDVARAQSDRYLQASALRNLGYMRERGSRFDEATPWYEQSAAVARESGAVRIRERALGALGWCYYRLGDFDRALRALSEAAELARKISDNLPLLIFLIN